ncbi:MAG TPA: hypothetical protein VK694_04140 [Verrucomicrobiae bacterium]|nr:hypothetical protein [Verrucomicrobiae bacterium]
MRIEKLDIEPVELCPDCPRRGDCRGVARVALDTIFKASFFTITVPKGDPDAFMGRVYVDDQGGESDVFLTQDDTPIRECKGPVVTKKRLFKPDDVGCRAFRVRLREIWAAVAEDEEQWAKERAQAIYLTPEETNGLIALEPAERRALATLPSDHINELILFNRNHPDRVDDLRQLSEA